MYLRTRGEHAVVRRERAPKREIDRPPVRIGHGGPEVAFDQPAGGVVPDPVALFGVARPAEKDIGLTPADDGVLALAVDPCRGPDRQTFLLERGHHALGRGLI